MAFLLPIFMCCFDNGYAMKKITCEPDFVIYTTLQQPTKKPKSGLLKYLFCGCEVNNEAMYEKNINNLMIEAAPDIVICKAKELQTKEQTKEQTKAVDKVTVETVPDIVMYKAKEQAQAVVNVAIEVTPDIVICKAKEQIQAVDNEIGDEKSLTNSMLEATPEKVISKIKELQATGPIEDVYAIVKAITDSNMLESICQDKDIVLDTYAQKLVLHNNVLTSQLLQKILVKLNRSCNKSDFNALFCEVFEFQAENPQITANMFFFILEQAVKHQKAEWIHNLLHNNRAAEFMTQDTVIFICEQAIKHKQWKWIQELLDNQIVVDFGWDQQIETLVLRNSEATAIFGDLFMSQVFKVVDRFPRQGTYYSFTMLKAEMFTLSNHADSDTFIKIADKVFKTDHVELLRDIIKKPQMQIPKMAAKAVIVINKVIDHNIRLSLFLDLINNEKVDILVVLDKVSEINNVEFLGCIIKRPQMQMPGIAARIATTINKVADRDVRLGLFLDLIDNEMIDVSVAAYALGCIIRDAHYGELVLVKACEAFFSNKRGAFDILIDELARYGQFDNSSSGSYLSIFKSVAMTTNSRNVLKFIVVQCAFSQHHEFLSVIFNQVKERHDLGGIKNFAEEVKLSRHVDQVTCQKITEIVKLAEIEGQIMGQVQLNNRFRHVLRSAQKGLPNLKNTIAHNLESSSKQ